MTALTVEQKAVIQDRSGNLVVEAGPGTGKTETLARRAVDLMTTSCCPEQIWCASYTRSAARFLQRRLISIDSAAGSIVCGTLHSFALRVVRRHGWRANVDAQAEIMPAADQLALVTRLAEHHQLPNTVATPRRMMELFSVETNSAQPLESHCGPALLPHLGKLQLVQHDALRFRRAHGLMDYDDIICIALDVLEECAGHLWLRYLLVDEAQDLTMLQLQFIRALADLGVTITAVGDRMQAIYGWRGAAPDVMQQLPQLLPQPVAQLNLTYNFRCPVPVVQAAAYLAAQAGAVPQQAVKPGKPVRHVVCSSDRAESGKVVEWITEHAPQDCAVIYRSSTHALLLESQLKAAGISYKKHGGLRHDDADLKDMVALIRVVVKPDQPCLIRILQTLPGVGPATARKMADQWPDCTAPPRSAERLLSLHSLLASCKNASPELVLAAAAEWLGVKLDAAVLAQAGSAESLRDMLDGLALGVDVDEPDQDCLTLCTGHYAKGNQWPHVCVIGCVGGRFVRPSAAEDNRLLYVALTRAAETLTTIAPLAFRRDDGLFVSGSPLLRG